MNIYSLIFYFCYVGARYFDRDGLDTPFGHPFLQINSFQQERVPTAQEVSDFLFNIVDRDIGNNDKVSHIFMTFGQFLDHDLVYVRHDLEECKGTQ